jgi:hypothetical protein
MLPVPVVVFACAVSEAPCWGVTFIKQKYLAEFNPR